ncbi:hypothetical protein HRI_002606100 [Hibiscus trionum]|uniref:F-box/LRR-repeat protein 15-like leucin rich repeat domain-containing protein n=1 Tax=Hibiscus trionum TaxID=183268 RepID=A0A9W7I5K8_HIBTR|nr:hypothetical protein HRI_002606100 [Hibiscus trionum]
MGDVGFSKKTDSRESEENLGENEEETAVFSSQQNAPSNLDLNRQPERVNLDHLFPGSGIPTDGFRSVNMGIDLTRERNPDAEIASSSSKKRKISFTLTREEIQHDLEMIGIAGEKQVEPKYIGFRHFEDEVARRERLKREKAERFHESAREFALDYACGQEDPRRDRSKSFTKKAAASKSVIVDDDGDKEQLGTPFGMAMEMIKTRSSRKRFSSDGLGVEFKWVPKNVKRLCPEVPSLLDLSLRALAKNADAIVSLNHVPDMLRHKLSRLLCDSRKMGAQFLQLLASGSPTEIRVNDGSQVTEDEFTKIFSCCDSNNLTVLQLDLCGSCMADYVLQDTLARSSKSLPALVTLSLDGAHRLSDEGLNMLALSAPALQSINLSQCSLLTSAGINNLANCFESTLRELYLDECHNIEAMVVLPALKKLKCLEVLSMAGIPTVCDDFVIQMVEACGKNMKDLVFANCLELTDVSIKSVGGNCSKLCAIDLSYLSKLTDKSMRYLANGCRSINRLKLSRNGFSDEAIAAFLEASGSDLTELSLNNITLVGLNTALALSKCSRKLFSLDLSWCRNLNDEALGLIVDSCLSLKQLKLFGCTQLTDVFLGGHSNPQVQIIGQELRTVSKFLNVLIKPQGPPLRYSPVGSLH